MKTVRGTRKEKALSWVLAALYILSITGLAPAGNYDSVILSDQPFAYYRFEDGSSNNGDVAADATGHYNGTYIGQPSLVNDAPGKIGGTSLKIVSGTPDSYVTAPLAPLGSLLGNGVSFEFWIKSTDTRTQKRIFGSFNTGSNTTVTVASNSGPTYQATVGSTQIFMRRQGGGDYGAAFDQSVVDIYDGNWHHVVWTADNMASPSSDPYKVYLDGTVVPLVYGVTWTSASFADFDNPFYIANAGRAAPLAANIMIEGQLDEFAIYSSLLTEEKILAHYDAALSRGVFSPADGSVDVPYDTVLSWTLPEHVGTYDVYFGGAFADVAEASRANPAGVLVGQSQQNAAYDPGPLQFSQTYYWRIDAVGLDNTVSKGDVLSFTVEPIAYVLAGDLVTATASSSNSGDEGPEKTINGSGLDADGLHSVEPTDMWLTGVVAAGQSAWIQYEFDKAYSLHQMVVWNHNTATESLIGFGIKNATIEYSIDGVTWTRLGEGHEFARAPGKVGYAANMTIDFGGAAAKYVRITIANNWGGVLPQYGLSEVGFWYIPMSAREPSPASGMADLEPSLTLRWRSGRQAASHDVYLSTDAQAVTDGTAPVITVSESMLDPSMLVLGQSYYWKVNEVNQAEDPAVWEGDVWNFTVTDFLVVDDFESYTDDDAAGKAIWQTWIDGYEVADNGSQVGNLTPPYAEPRIVHGGRQSMPLFYNNTGTAVVSEAERTWLTPQDWTLYEANTLVLYFQGRPIGFLERSPGNVVMSAAGRDIFGTVDEFRFVHKRLVGNATIVARVQGIDNTHAWAKGGVMIRESLDPGAKHAMVVVTPGNGVSFQRRTSTDNATYENTVAGVQAPQWVKLTRTGDVFTAHYSADGTAWQSINATDETGNPVDLRIAMTGTVYIGLALTGHTDSAVATAEFTDISTTGNVTGAWETTEIGLDHPNNDPERLYVEVQDSAGRTKAVSYPDPEATLLVGWQEWVIPLSEFSSAGVNMSGVKKMYIGVGNRENPSAGRVGVVYIDDVRVGRLAPPGEYDNIVLSDQPFAYYRFEDASSNNGDTAADATGAYDGTYVGQPSLVSDAPARIGGSSLEILIGDTESYVTAPLAPFGSLLGQGVSFEFWIKSTDTRTRKRIFGTFNNGSNTSVTIASNAGPSYETTVGSTQIFMRRQGGGDHAAAFDQSVIDIYDGNWHHVVWTADNMASPSGDPYKVYVDGTVAPLVYGATWTTAEFVDFDNPFYIAQSGRATPFAGAAIEGRLDEFAVYNTVLTEEKILIHYQR